mmetsp:Transcript_18628/g.58342  ORF Transcript_18628/g.58342 Transcript_18628/m.58342 type:complete len:219 (+) Transcript_18628:401-1057(+)
MRLSHPHTDASSASANRTMSDEVMMPTSRPTGLTTHSRLCRALSMRAAASCIVAVSSMQAGERDIADATVSASILRSRTVFSAYRTLAAPSPPSLSEARPATLYSRSVWERIPTTLPSSRTGAPVIPEASRMRAADIRSSSGLRNTTSAFMKRDTISSWPGQFCSFRPMKPSQEGRSASKQGCGERAARPPSAGLEGGSATRAAVVHSNMNMRLAVSQ